jgi:hypothetical protein
MSTSSNPPPPPAATEALAQYLADLREQKEHYADAALKFYSQLSRPSLRSSSLHDFQLSHNARDTSF